MMDCSTDKMQVLLNRRWIERERDIERSNRLKAEKTYA